MASTSATASRMRYTTTPPASEPVPRAVPASVSDKPLTKADPTAAARAPKPMAMRPPTMTPATNPASTSHVTLRFHNS